MAHASTTRSVTRPTRHCLVADAPTACNSRKPVETHERARYMIRPVFQKWRPLSLSSPVE
ncbi:hypothetical protein PAXRUDRAFT_832286 [Paxillus rubicundulus Ve08.2h10]|uniref:Unplaced genomic scaffold scaffold_822, whole genome shotgun sequence n=1 Tax=Paxillus rubicundulus Ve08.2h10 TaxID=930991 RepID=A0A0D0DDB4_9AGAM|nr:hypothetical protein PAXRUDRAFT_832286 [Paxillus rubicundulus Ve08.2h10]